MPSLERREVSIGHRTLVVSGGSRSCGPPKLVPLFNESGKLVPTSHRWGHQHQSPASDGVFFSVCISESDDGPGRWLEG